MEITGIQPALTEGRTERLVNGVLLINVPKIGGDTEGNTNPTVREAEKMERMLRVGVGVPVAVTLNPVRVRDRDADCNVGTGVLD